LKVNSHSIGAKNCTVNSPSPAICLRCASFLFFVFIKILTAFSGDTPCHC
jgi:hypothetical protein